MPFVVNPKMEVRILLSDMETITGYNMDHSPAYSEERIVTKGYFMDFEITKDIDEETNEAELHIYNLGPETRGKFVDAANMGAPIEILLSATGKSDLIVAFRGELETAKNTYTQPGYDTHIIATSQQRNHRSIYVDRSATR